MNDDTVRLVEVPADTWRAVVDALRDGEMALRGSEALFKHFCDLLLSYHKDGVEVELANQQARSWTQAECGKINVQQRALVTALELARKVTTKN